MMGQREWKFNFELNFEFQSDPSWISIVQVFMLKTLLHQNGPSAWWNEKIREDEAFLIKSPSNWSHEKALRFFGLDKSAEKLISGPEI